MGSYRAIVWIFPNGGGVDPLIRHDGLDMTHAFAFPVPVSSPMIGKVDGIVALSGLPPLAQLLQPAQQQLEVLRAW